MEEKSGRLIITARHTLNVMVILYTSLVHIHFASCLCKLLRLDKMLKFGGSVTAAGTVTVPLLFVCV